MGRGKCAICLKKRKMGSGVDRKDQHRRQISEKERWRREREVREHEQI